VGRRFYGADNIILHPYSLVEMLVVMAIIAILIGLGAGGYTVAHRWLAKSRTEAILAKLKIALEAYKNDKGYYPLPNTNLDKDALPPADAANFRLDVNAKDFNPPDTADEHQPRNNMNKFVDYSKIQQDQSYKVSGNPNVYYVKDGWNSPVESPGAPFGPNVPAGPIKYRCPGLVNKTSFDLYSAGPDRKFASDPATDTEDDIYCKL
jgi:prepilin-type N-terminal cleavage/methylation domain-containing protein